MESRIFKCALITSVLIHLFAGIVFFFSQFHYQKKLKKDTLEVVYQAQAEKLPKEPFLKKKKDLIDKKMERLPDLARPEGVRVPKIRKMKERVATPEKFSKRSLPKISHKSEKRKIKVPVLKSDKAASPQYMSYHDRIRNRIRDRAYFYVEDPRFEEGDVYLTFVLAKDGSLKHIQIIPEKTRANDYLRSVGLRSVKESAPFAPFPKELDYPELSFNALISFEIGE